MDAPRPPLSVGGFMAQIGDCWHLCVGQILTAILAQYRCQNFVTYDVAGVAITRGGRGECIDGCIVVIGGDRMRRYLSSSLLPTYVALLEVILLVLYSSQPNAREIRCV